MLYQSFAFSEKERPKIIACDFDGTLFTDAYPGVGQPIYLTINMLKNEQKQGAKIILWTNRSDQPLANAIEACKKEDLFFDSINDNLPEIVTIFGCNTRKIFADEYWDDRTRSIPHLSHPGKIELKMYER